MSQRRLVVNADDFGRSSGINRAVIQAHREGILTTASLMVNEAAAGEAVALAREEPRLGVGLHLTLLRGTPALTPGRIPGLTAPGGGFATNPVTAGFRYFACPGLRAQLRDEIDAQFSRFRQTGLTLDHVNGHLHLHLHPTVFSILMENAKDWGITHLRLTREPFRIDARLARGRWVQRLASAAIHHGLAANAAGSLRRRGIKHTRQVFGLLQTGQVDEGYVARLLRELPPGDSELYSHPALDQFRHEFDALVSPSNKSLVGRLGIRLVRYQDL